MDLTFGFEGRLGRGLIDACLAETGVFTKSIVPQEEQEAQLSLKWADRTACNCIRRPESDFQSQKKAIFKSNYSSIRAIVTLPYRDLQ